MWNLQIIRGKHPFIFSVFPFVCGSSPLDITSSSWQLCIWLGNYWFRHAACKTVGVFPLKGNCIKLFLCGCTPKSVLMAYITDLHYGVTAVIYGLPSPLQGKNELLRLLPGHPDLFQRQELGSPGPDSVSVILARTRSLGTLLKIRIEILHLV